MQLEMLSDVRSDELLELSSFTDVVDEQINDVASALNWTVESITRNNQSFLTCPYDSSHRLTEKSLEQHHARCQWKSEGYGETDLPLSEPSISGPSSIKLDVTLQNDILRRAKEENPSMNAGTGERLIPRTSDRLLTDFTCDERKALYEYVIAHTIKPETDYDITNIHNMKSEQKEDKELSFLELLVQERNLKRRRAKHRGVHTNKKSYTEILREVITQEMEIYIDYTKQKDTETRKGRESRNSGVDRQKVVDSAYAVLKESMPRYRDSKETDTYYLNTKSDRRSEKSSRKYDDGTRDNQSDEKYSRSAKESTRKHHRHEYRKRSRSREHKSHKKDKHRRHKSHSRRSRENDKWLHDRYNHHDDKRKDRVKVKS